MTLNVKSYIYVDVYGKIVSLNKAAQNLTGWSQAEAAGLSVEAIFQIVKQDTNLGIDCSSVRFLREGFDVGMPEGIQIIAPIVAKGENEHEDEVVCNVFREGDAAEIQCKLGNISERRLLEDVAAREAHRLAADSREKDEFLAMLSHELRNPLASLLNVVQIFNQTPRGDPARRRAHQILERQVELLNHLVSDILEVSRLTTGNICCLRREHCDARLIVERAIVSSRSLIEALKHKLVVSLPPRPIWLDADPIRLEQVVIDLINNAAMYTDSPGRLILELRQDEAKAVIRMTDSGIGISPVLLPHVFELFTQADRSLARAQGGLGVGLALVKHLVELHGGTVEARSAGLGLGSEFVVRLPARTAPTNPEALDLPDRISR